MDLLSLPLGGAEYLAVDCETNGRAGEECEVTEVAAVLVGGGELHETFSSLVAVSRPLSAGIQRFTGIRQDMLAAAAPPEAVLGELVARLAGRVLVAHSASFDRRVLHQACAAAGVPWPDPPALCTLGMARRLLPLQPRRELGALADALGIEVGARHRALPDAETCARVFCALLPRLAAHAGTIGEALELVGSGARRRRRARERPEAERGASGRRGSERRGSERRAGGRPRRGRARSQPALDFGSLPRQPGVYIFRDAAGRPLYVGKSVCLATRARSHFAPSAPRPDWAEHAAAVDHRVTGSELGALVLENRLIKRLRPPGNIALAPRERGWIYLRCRLEDPFPVLELAPEPAAGHAVNVGPVRGRRAAAELIEQLDSLFGLRHCPRRLARRPFPSAYGQMGRCLSPCLGDLDPNLYRRRLDAALELFGGADDGRARLLSHVEAQVLAASVERRYERAAGLQRRLARLRALLERLGGVLRATHAEPALLAAPHPGGGSWEGFWVIEGRVRDWGPLPVRGGREPALLGELVRRSRAALPATPVRGPGVHLAPGEVDEVRIVSAWRAEHEPAGLALDPAPDAPALAGFLGSLPAAG